MTDLEVVQYIIGRFYRAGRPLTYMELSKVMLELNRLINEDLGPNVLQFEEKRVMCKKVAALAWEHFGSYKNSPIKVDYKVKLRFPTLVNAYIDTVLGVNINFVDRKRLIRPKSIPLRREFLPEC